MAFTSSFVFCLWKQADKTHTSRRLTPRVVAPRQGPYILAHTHNHASSDEAMQLLFKLVYKYSSLNHCVWTHNKEKTKVCKPTYAHNKAEHFSSVNHSTAHALTFSRPPSLPLTSSCRVDNNACLRLRTSPHPAARACTPSSRCRGLVAQRGERGRRCECCGTPPTFG